jgi:hypothetical protein
MTTPERGTGTAATEHRAGAAATDRGAGAGAAGWRRARPVGAAAERGGAALEGRAA